MQGFLVYSRLAEIVAESLLLITQLRKTPPGRLWLIIRIMAYFDLFRGEKCSDLNKKCFLHAEQSGGAGEQCDS